MREIDNAEVGRDPVHDALAESHRIVNDAEIGHEDNGWRRLHGRLLRDKTARAQEREANNQGFRVIAELFSPELVSSA